MSTLLAGTIHRDTAEGRGSAAFTLGATDSVDDALRAGLMRAGAAIGPAWRSPSPSAPARVMLADPSVETASLAKVSRELVEQAAAAARAAGAELVDVQVEVAVEAVQLITRRGVDARWPETRFEIVARVRRDGVEATIARVVRRREELGVGGEMAEALDAAARRTKALQTPTGRIAVALRAAALLHGGRGLFEAVVAQADPALERQGLVRYRPGQPVAAGALAVAEPLTVSSDGTLPFGLRSAPLDENGAAVRRFEMIGKGVARDLSLDGREASLRGMSPNGGARGIVVPAGTHPESALVGGAASAGGAGAGGAGAGGAGGGPLLVVEQWSWLDVAPVTGNFRAGIALGRLVDRAGTHDVTGGIVRGDALSALALSTRSRERVTTPEYHGPAVWLLGELFVD
ncbi:MAG TPA: metallopeptidase TldD-related protein [Kofleriaceae bacterium]|nr:metallopeptidase TldD-related protein [Kofleriaceae bacterium]